MLFKPKYTITDKILNNLTLISASREFIEQSRIVPQWEARLKRYALLHSTHASTAIEGNKLTLKQVEDLADGRKVIASPKDKQEVLNYLEALNKMPALAKKGKFKTETLLQIHKLITKETMEDNSCCGVFRSKQVFVGKRYFDGTSFKEEVVYMPPKTEEVPGLVKEFIDWLNNEDAWELNPVLLAGLVHYEIVRIHPFIDGNGRTARLFASLVLYLSGFDHRRLFALDDYYDRARQAYYDALKTVDKETRDLTKWLEYFTDGVAVSINEVKESIVKSGLASGKTGKGQIALTSKQMKIVEYINKNDKVTNKDLQAIFNISAQAVHKDLVKLVNMKLIKPVGKGRTLHYVLVDD